MLRDDQVELTRKRILDAFDELAVEHPSGRISVAQVAQRSGVSAATIYRHVANRSDLVHAAATRDVHAGVPADVEAWGIAEMRDHLVAIWSDLERNPRLAREHVVTEVGREQRLIRFHEFRESIGAALDRAGLPAELPAHAAALAAIALLSSAHTFLDLHDRQGLNAARAADVAMWAVERILTGLGLDPDAFAIRDRDDLANDNREDLR